jgi:hypothetical protein
VGGAADSQLELFDRAVVLRFCKNWHNNFSEVLMDPRKDLDADRQSAADPNNEAGSIGDEQNPADENIKTDKHRWTYAADRNAKESSLPRRVREFLNGL